MAALAAEDEDVAAERIGADDLLAAMGPSASSANTAFHVR
jgi:hypothetical protein